MAAWRMIPRTKPIPTGGFTDQNYPHHQVGSPENIFEFDDSESWTSSSYQVVPSLNNLRRIDILKKLQQPRKAADINAVVASSLPVDIPDWSKILKDDYNHRDRHQGEGREDEYWDEEDDREGGEGAEHRTPPHEYLARRRGASFSVHEGVGRTLKGRDLRRVRNAVWKKVGFED